MEKEKILFMILNMKKLIYELFLFNIFYIFINIFYFLILTINIYKLIFS